MSENARRDREQALAALESSPRVEEQSIVATAPTPAPAPGKASGVGQVVAGTGLAGLVLAADQALQQHGTTLADLTMKSGPLVGSLVANWPLVALVAWAVLRAKKRWDDHVTWGHHRATAQDNHARAQVRAIRAVADEIIAVRGDLAVQAAAHHTLSGRVDAVEREVRQLREQLPEPRRAARRAEN